MKQFSADQILHILDEGAKSFRFPALDNGYVYPCASRLSLHRSDADWGLVFETFGFAPRGGSPDLTVTTFASNLSNRKQLSDFGTEEAYQNYVNNFPNDEITFFYPIDDESWQDTEDVEFVAADAKTVNVRGNEIQIPTIAIFSSFGVELEEPSRLQTFELCRYIAETRRDLVLGTPPEVKVNLPQGAVEILRLDEWHHPDTIAGEAPSATPTFRELAAVLATGDSSAYKTNDKPTSHWSNWPDGGTL